MELMRTPRLLLRHRELLAAAATTGIRWSGLTARQFRKVTIGRCQAATPG